MKLDVQLLCSVIPSEARDLFLSLTRSSSVGSGMILVLLLLCPHLTAQKSPRPATQDEESRMFGRILGAVEDEGGGYLTEALSRLSSIESDLKKREYSARIRWMAHFEHGKTLLAAKKSKQAVQFLEIAQKDAESLTEKEQKETAASLSAARANVH